jgi:hypothetical protein
VRRQQPHRFGLVLFRIDHCELLAERVGHDQPFRRRNPELHPWGKRQRQFSDDLCRERLGAGRVLAQFDHRQMPRPERRHEAAASVVRHAHRHRVGRDVEPSDRAHSAAGPFEQHKLVPRFVGGDEKPLARQHGQIRQHLPHGVFGHHIVRRRVDHRNRTRPAVGGEQQRFAVEQRQRDRAAEARLTCRIVDRLGFVCARGASQQRETGCGTEQRQRDSFGSGSHHQRGRSHPLIS